jgi:hypothetical protein
MSVRSTCSWGTLDSTLEQGHFLVISAPDHAEKGWVQLRAVLSSGTSRDGYPTSLGKDKRALWLGWAAGGKRQPRAFRFSWKSFCGPPANPVGKLYTRHRAEQEHYE